ncbi:penicillin-binding protein 2 [Candidatus Parcubacteria bacterium]|nr:penicillin-binding protein 2 [Patescibacteria group bacterium]MBU4467034.1 penicillin-binding protein 2 [Patescibacteria group bacterium]MCG2688439.1 penicillin-binding protein 2 [Candidatus Parcubacteria bacterium]
MNNKRLKLIIFLLFLIGAVIIGRLFWIQIVKGKFYKAMAQGQQRFFENVTGARGEILFANGEKLATNKIRYFVYISPRDIKDKEKTKEALKQILDLEESFIEKKVNNDSLYELLETKATPDQIDKLQRINFPGIHIGQEDSRIFPQGTMASSLIGFVDSEKQGQYGLESYYQEILKGDQGMIKGEKGLGGLLISSDPMEEIKNGSTLILTLDHQVQFKAEKLLIQAQENLNIESGTIIVVRPSSGEIVALASFPNFDPNSYEQEKDMAVFQNQAIQSIFEPGSVFKPFTIAAALEEKKITPETAYVDKGIVRIGKTSIYNYAKRIYGEQTMTQVLEKSINTGAVFAEQQLGSNLFLEYLDKFGFFQKTDIDTQGEVYSKNQEFKKGYEINFATASFGQGIEITPIQLVKAYCAIANNGKMPKPHLIKEIVNEVNGKGLIQKIRPELSQNIISPETSAKVTSMMVSVIENGYSKKAKIPGYFIAGKTGTAQVPEEGTYSSDKTIQSFVGFAPAFKPEFLILVKLDNPQTNTAEYSAMPIFHDLAKYIIDLWQIPPDYEL